MWRPSAAASSSFISRSPAKVPPSLSLLHAQSESSSSSSSRAMDEPIQIHSGIPRCSWSTTSIRLWRGWRQAGDRQGPVRPARTPATAVRPAVLLRPLPQLQALPIQAGELDVAPLLRTRARWRPTPCTRGRRRRRRRARRHARPGLRLGRSRLQEQELLTVVAGLVTEGGNKGPRRTDGGMRSKRRERRMKRGDARDVFDEMAQREEEEEEDVAVFFSNLALFLPSQPDGWARPISDISKVLSTYLQCFLPQSVFWCGVKYHES